MPGFRPLSFKQLCENFDKLSIDELNKHGAKEDFDVLSRKSPERAAQLTYVDNVISVLKKAQMDEQRKAWILTAALMEVKRQIAATYWVRSADNSHVHANTDKTVGISPENKMDVASANLARAELVAFMRQQEYKAEVMKGVEKPEYLGLDLTNKSPVTPRAISSAAAAMQRMNPKSKHHVVVKEPELDTSHMNHKNYRHPKAGEQKHHRYEFSDYTRSYIRSDEKMTEEERKLNEQHYDIHMRKADRVHNDLVRNNKKRLHHVTPSEKNFHWMHQPTLTEEDIKPGFKNKEIYDSRDWTDHLDEDELLRARRQQYKETTLNPQVKMFDRSKLKHAETKETHEPVMVMRRK